MSINLINIARPFEVSSSIVEWDIKRAGLNLIREHKLLSEDLIEKFSEMPKKESDIAIGKLQIKDKDFSKKLDQAFTDIMKEFLEVNHIDMDFDVTSIKKDACFVINKDVKQAEFGKYIKFIPKNEYHAYVYLVPIKIGKTVTGRPLEIYFHKDDTLDIKGLVGNRQVRETILSLHKDGMVNFLLYTVQLAERSGIDPKTMNSFLHNFVDMYKKRELDFDYYREFSIESKFRYQLYDTETMADMIDASMLNRVNIEYNYINIILPLINLIV